MGEELCEGAVGREEELRLGGHRGASVCAWAYKGETRRLKGGRWQE